MRPLLVLLHRWVGLFMAAFLFLTGVTGAVISWDHELDEALNPHLIHASSGQVEPGTPLALREEVERKHPLVYVSYFPLAVEDGHSIPYWVEPRVNPATGKLHDVDYNQVFVDPVTKQELGTREWGAVWPLTRETFVSFLYKLHYSLHVPEMWGTDRVGVWLLGLVAILWTLDCFVGFALTLPARQRSGRGVAEPAQPAAPGTKTWFQKWKPSWTVRTQRGGYKLNFDLHRAFGLWTWGVVFLVALTAVSMNLEWEVTRPLVKMVSNVTPTVWDQRTYLPDDEGHVPRQSFSRIVSLAEKEATRRGWDAPPGHVYYSRNVDVFGVAFFSPEEDHGVAGAGHREVRLDGQTGEILEVSIPWTGTAADIFFQAQFPIHSGRILGLPGRILISFMGLVVAMLSVTGVVIWWQKRTSRLRAAQRRGAASKRSLAVRPDREASVSSPAAAHGR